MSKTTNMLCRPNTEHDYCYNQHKVNESSFEPLRDDIGMDDANNGDNTTVWQSVSYGNKRRLPSGSGGSFQHKKTCSGSTQPNSNDIQLKNSFEALNTAGMDEDVSGNRAEDVKKDKPPPIFVPDISDVRSMVASIDRVISKDNYTYKCVTRDKVKINTLNIESYRSLVKYLTEKGVCFHTYQIKRDRAYRVVLKNMHFSNEPHEIKAAIEDYGHSVRNISNLRSTISKEPLCIFFIDLEPAPNNKDIFKIEYLLNAKITFESPIKRNEVVQCKRCQRYGHTKTYCRYPNRCVKCGLNHDTSSCKKTTNTPPKCALCDGEHPANYKGCSVYKDLKNKAYPPLRKPRDVPSPSTNSTNAERQVQSTGTGEPTDKIKPSLYADVVSGKKLDSSKNFDLEEVFGRFEKLMEQQAQQIGTLINLLTTVISKLK